MKDKNIIEIKSEQLTINFPSDTEYICSEKFSIIQHKTATIINTSFSSKVISISEAINIQNKQKEAEIVNYIINNSKRF
ncbi:hypothetical protein SAMN05443543_101563 [Flavobacterium flevense]|uniref:Uncharacterized protein n=1 Tax=Flavobacterium flevense TaxID=983 RepID=A0A4Y4AXN1_9FLAO|nr:hypothetical protein [Flavobacterium flevense]GEC71810.1 hypothetical protein FFL01_13490 [Flavobacterium flevense]SHL37373.1 hypothetical protein SAMN05443543_101563 [Flavobacterium flevense]